MVQNNYHLFVKRNGIEDEPLIGCEENVKSIQYNPHFDFEIFQEHPNDIAFSLELFVWNEIYDAKQRDSMYFPCPPAIT